VGHVRDRWTDVGPKGRRVRNERWGHGKRWQARWSEHGVEKASSFPSRDAADAHLMRVQIGGPSRRTSLTVTAYADVWLSEQLHYAPSTAKAARDRMRVMVLPALGKMPLGEVTRGDVQRSVAVWSRKYAPRTVHQGYSFLTTMFATAMRDGLVPATPCAGVKLPPVHRRHVLPMSALEVEQVADAVLPWYRAMVVLGAATGMRGAEMRGLTTDRLVGGDVVVDRQLDGVQSGRPVFAPPKSDAGDRRIALGSVASDALAEHMAEFPPGVDGLIFTTRQHGPVNRTRAAEAWAAGIKGLDRPDRSGWHELRHHHASVLIAAGMSAKAVAERLGHADASETWRTYAHLWPADHAQMAEVADAALAGLRGRDADVITLRRA
jgi:integrase